MKGYGALLSDGDVRRWYENVARGSRVTADVYLRRLGNFCSKADITPKRLAAMRVRELEDFLLDFVSESERRSYTGSYVHSTMKAVRSWLGHNRKQLKIKIRINGTQDTPSLKEERVPTKDELRRILLSGDKKARAATILMAHSGLRVESLGNYKGDDGLRIVDIPDLSLEGGSVKFVRRPARLVVRRNLSKARHQYISFISDEACEIIRDYLEERARSGEVLTPDSPLITPKRVRKPFITSTNVSDSVRSAIRGAGYGWRPYVLRSYFDTQLMLAESRGLVLRDYRQFWMGHKGDMENRYTTHKGRLPDEVVEDMRGAYRACEPFLSTIASTIEASSAVKEAKVETLKSIAKSLLNLDLMEVKVAKEREEGRALTMDESIGLFEEEIKKARVKESQGDPQVIVSEEELESRLREGWEFVNVLPSKRILIRHK